MNPEPSTECRTGAVWCRWHGVFAEARVAPVRQLRQRHGVRRAAAEVGDARLVLAAMFHLREQHRHEVARMQAVAHLMAVAVEADVFQRTPAQMRIDPERKNSLVGFAELARAREHAAAIDPDGKMERLARIPARRPRPPACWRRKARWAARWKIFR